MSCKSCEYKMARKKKLNLPCKWSLWNFQLVRADGSKWKVHRHGIIVHCDKIEKGLKEKEEELSESRGGDLPMQFVMQLPYRRRTGQPRCMLGNTSVQPNRQLRERKIRSGEKHQTEREGHRGLISSDARISISLLYLWSPSLQRSNKATESISLFFEFIYRVQLFFGILQLEN